MDTMIEGVSLTPLKIIESSLGNVMHALRRDDSGFHSFGEAYFSTVKAGAVKGWKKHTVMVINLVVPVGKIRFVVYDDRLESTTKGKYFTVTLSSTDNYQRLTVHPGLWVAFEGIGEGENVLLNIASIKHDPAEAENIDVKSGQIQYPYD